MKFFFDITIKSIVRDRIFHGILFASLLFFLIPSVAGLSMRQMTELSVNLSLALISLILLLLAVFLGSTHIWKDLERRYTYSTLSLPVSRTVYIAGKFLGIAVFLLVAACIMGVVSSGIILYSTGVYPPERPVVWSYLMVAIVCDAMKYMLVVAIAFLFSSVATSFFLPMFGTICVFMIGNSSQQVYDYVTAQTTKEISFVTKQIATCVYYILPNFSAFDFKVNAVYGIPINGSGLLYVIVYFLVYLIGVLTLAALLFEKREIT